MSRETPYLWLPVSHPRTLAATFRGAKNQLHFLFLSAALELVQA